MLLDKDVLIAAVAALGAIGTAAVGAWGNMHRSRGVVSRREADTARKELAHTKQTFEVSEFLSNWDAFYWRLQKLMNDTGLDRFLLLRAWNGKNDPKYTTAVIQIREGAQQPVSYVHVELDDDYIRRLIKVRKEGFIYFVVNEINDGLIKSIYQSEGVKASLWVFLSEEAQEGGSVRLTYASFATHKSEGFSNDEVTQMRLLFASLKSFY